MHVKVCIQARYGCNHADASQLIVLSRWPVLTADGIRVAGEEQEGKETCTVGRSESAAVTLTCDEGYMLQVPLLLDLKLAIHMRVTYI